MGRARQDSIGVCCVRAMFYSMVKTRIAFRQGRHTGRQTGRQEAHTRANESIILWLAVRAWRCWKHCICKAWELTGNGSIIFVGKCPETQEAFNSCCSCQQSGCSLSLDKTSTSCVSLTPEGAFPTIRWSFSDALEFDFVRRNKYF